MIQAHTGDADGAPVSWLPPGSARVVGAVWGENQQTEDLSLLFHCHSALQIKKSLLKMAPKANKSSKWKREIEAICWPGCCPRGRAGPGQVQRREKQVCFWVHSPRPTGFAERQRRDWTLGWCCLGLAGRAGWVRGGSIESGHLTHRRSCGEVTSGSCSPPLPHSTQP